MKNFQNDKKSAQLGMPLGTANGRLMKLLMFDLAKRLGLAVCFRCGAVIEEVREFSVDHKAEWLHVDPALFWDLSNIAFSHLSCNSRASRGAKPPGPPGMEWCSGHQAFHAKAAFGAAPASGLKKRRGLRYHCNEYRRANGWDK